MRRILILLLLLPAASLSCSGGNGETYPVKITRTAKVGDKFRIVSSGSVSSMAEGTGLPRKTEEYEWEFTAVAEVLELDESGAPAKLHCKVEKCVDSTGPVKELMPKGYDLFVVFKNGVVTFPFDRPLPPEAAQLAVATLLTIGEPGVDLAALFGGETPRAIGEKWAADVTALMSKASEGGQQLDKDAYTGEARLRGKTTVNGIECLDLHCEATLKALIENVEWTLGGDTVIEVEADMKLPIDPSLPVLAVEHSSSIKTDSKATGLGGAASSFKSEIKKSVETTFEPLEGST
ncbi:MAG: hypothetical protein ACYTAN_15415 [Planctomycetota bacterium]|jgi:hypothetical protein